MEGGRGRTRTEENNFIIIETRMKASTTCIPAVQGFSAQFWTHKSWGDMQTVCNSIDFPLGYMRWGIPLWFGITADKTNCEWITMLFTDYALLPGICRALNAPLDLYRRTAVQYGF